MPTNPSGSSPGNKPDSGNGAASDDGESSTSALLKKSGDGAQRESTPVQQSGTAGVKPSRGDVPESPRASEAPPENTPGAGPPAGASGASSTTGAVDRWGDLPVYASDVFRTEGGADFPSAYRDFVDAYYKRLNQRR
jgi:hypothetical protein